MAQRFQPIKDNPEQPEFVKKVESAVGPRKIIACPWNCDDGYRGGDACNRCGKTGSGFRYQGKFYPNTVEGWSDAWNAVNAK